MKTCDNCHADVGENSVVFTPHDAAKPQHLCMQCFEAIEGGDKSEKGA